MSQATPPSMILYALLTLLLATPGGLGQEEDPAPRADRIRADVEYLASDELEGRDSGRPGNVAAAAYIAAAFRSVGLTPCGDGGTYFQEFEFGEKVRTRNVVGLLEGSDPRRAAQVVVLCAHFDHVGVGDQGEDRIYNGADDNASGTAVVLELARLLASRRERPARSILFVGFSAEERGLLGSAHYVAHPLFPLERHVAVVNLDMVGKGAARLDVSGTGSSARWPGTLADASRGAGFAPLRLREWYDANSDHAPFLDRGVPGLHYFTGVHADYHQPSDEADRLDYEGAAAIARHALRLVLALAGAEEAPPWTAPPVLRPRPLSLVAEREGPFSYPLRPRDLLGTPGGRTPIVADGEGAIGPLRLFAGAEPVPVLDRIRVLRDAMPILASVRYEGGLVYRTEAYVTPAAVLFVRVAVTSSAAGPATAYLAADLAGRPEAESWVDGRLLREDRLAAIFRPLHHLHALQGPRFRWRIDLPPGKRRTFDFRVPLEAIDGPAEIEALEAADHETEKARAIEAWKRLLEGPTTFEIPEPKVAETIRASFVRLLLTRRAARDGRETALVARGLDLLGRHALAAEAIGGGPSDEAWWPTLQALGAHVRLTGDVELAARHAAAIEPPAWALEPGDDVGAWRETLLGLAEATDLAAALGRPADSARYQSLREALRDRFLERLEQACPRTDLSIPARFDDPLAGPDVLPFDVLPADDPRVAATLERLRGFKAREGILTGGPNAWTVESAERAGEPRVPETLDLEGTFDATEALLALGRQEEAIQDLYSILVHTSTTHADPGGPVPPWGDRSASGEALPGAAFAARYLELVRHLLVREEGRTLHLGNALAPAWVAPGAMIRVVRAPTNFGPVSFTIASADLGCRIELAPEWRSPPDRVVFHVPWHVEAGAREVELPAGPGATEVAWRRVEVAEVSFEAAVARYLRRYHLDHGDDDPGFLFERTRPPRLVSPDLFVARTAVVLAPRGEGDVLRFTTDGSTPGPGSAVYQGPFEVDRTTIVRAMAVGRKGPPSPPATYHVVRAEPRPAGEPPPLRPGLAFEYHTIQLERLPDFSRLEPARRGEASTFSLAAIDHAEDDFAVRFTGWLEVPADGVYTFTTTSDDGSRLSIGSTLVVDNDGLHAPLARSGRIALGRGWHPIAVEFFERGGGQVLAVEYAGPGIDRQPIPGTALGNPD